MPQTIDGGRLEFATSNPRFKGAGSIAEQFSVFGRQKQAFAKGFHLAAEGSYWGMPLIAASAAVSGRGEMLPAAVAGGVSLGVQPVISGAISAGLVSLVGCPPAAAAFAAVILTGMAATRLEHSLVRGFKTLTREGQMASTLQFGAGFKDSVSAQQRRQRAAMELTGALGTSRRWLGQEALYLHNR